MMVVAPFILAIATVTAVASAEGAGMDPTMRNPHLPPITSLVILSSGATAPTSAASRQQCGLFKLSNQEARSYIQHAAEVAEHDYLHQLDWSPCYTSGKVTFNNGITGTWSIQQYRAGSLKLSNGRTLYLYCPRCQATAFPVADE